MFLILSIIRRLYKSLEVLFIVVESPKCNTRWIDISMIAALDIVVIWLEQCWVIMRAIWLATSYEWTVESAPVPALVSN
jgi:hypothetical protein